MRKWLVVAALGASLTAAAQNEEDALRYSLTQPGGTARSWGLGGAIGAVGADPGSVSVNPAGMGLYNTSEVSLTPGFEVNDVTAKHYGTSTSNGVQRLFMNNMALILNYPAPSGHNWRGGTFGLSFDRQASFHTYEHIVGQQVNSTMLQHFVNEANGTDWSTVENGGFPFSSTLAWYTYGIDTVPGGNGSTYFPGIPYGSDVKQDRTVDASGRLNTTSFFYANNYRDKLYVGLSLGLVGSRFERHTTHNETSLDDANDLHYFQYKEDLVTTGSGIDLKIGVLGRVTDKLRLGLAFHSPMWLLMSDSYSYHMTTSFQDGTPITDDSPDGVYSYRVNTPWRVVASAAYVVGKHGLVSVDYTYADYRQMRLRASNTQADEYDFSYEDQVIRDSFVGTHNLRVGTEWRSGKWYLRGGAGFIADPYETTDGRHGTSQRQFTFGLGYRATHVSLDLGGIYGLQDTNTYLYEPALIQPTSESWSDVRTLLTLAFRP